MKKAARRASEGCGVEESGAYAAVPLAADWTKHGTKMIGDVRNRYPAVYLRTVASLARDQPPCSVQNVELSDLTDSELIELVEEEVAQFKKSTR